MLYLIKDSRGVKLLVKVGITKNLQKRMDTYKTHNPLAKCIEVASVVGVNDKLAEGAIHDYYETIGYSQIKGTEWYEVPKGLKKDKGYTFEAFLDNYSRHDFTMEVTKI